MWSSCSFQCHDVVQGLLKIKKKWQKLNKTKISKSKDNHKKTSIKKWSKQSWPLQVCLWTKDMSPKWGSCCDQSSRCLNYYEWRKLYYRRKDHKHHHKPRYAHIVVKWTNTPNQHISYNPPPNPHNKILRFSHPLLWKPEKYFPFALRRFAYVDIEGFMWCLSLVSGGIKSILVIVVSVCL